MQKTCELCGGFFDASRKNQKYCKECGKDSARAARKLEYAVVKNKAHAGDLHRVQDRVCNQCGKKFKTTYGTNYCSDACFKEHLIEIAKCIECGDLLTNHGMRQTHNGYCSDACRDKHKIRVAKDSGRYKTCEYCGKEFIAKYSGARFCCHACYLTYKQAHKQASKPAEIKAMERDAAKERTTEGRQNAAYIRRCAECGKEFSVRFGSTQKYCSDKCKADAKRPKLKNGQTLCTVCRTSQADCERFTSNFVYCPIGCVTKQIRGKLVVTSCPKYT